ncbi:MAG TPA: heparinase, partial [Novosphingobium sp.]|nr:heparinase [Novosphingobium sp.]
MGEEAPVAGERGHGASPQAAAPASVSPGHAQPASALPASPRLPFDEGEDTPASRREQLIEPSRALAIADFAPPRVNAGEWLIRLSYRLGMPASGLVGAFRKPARVRLLATVESPRPGDRAAGIALRAGHFLIHGLKLPIGQVDFAGAARLTPPAERMVHGFHWLADLSSAAPLDVAAPVAERILAA